MIKGGKSIIRPLRFPKELVFLLLCLWLTGCATSPPTKFYLLNPVPQPQNEEAKGENHQPTVIRVDGVQIPGYLDRREIVTRLSENEIHLADLNQWGEPLRDAITNLLALNLSRLLPAKDFIIFPFKSPAPVTYQLSVEILRLDGSLNGDVYLTAQWSILQGNKGNLVMTRKSVFKADSGPADYRELVATESRLLETLSREIADAIRSKLPEN